MDVRNPVASCQESGSAQGIVDSSRQSVVKTNPRSSTSRVNALARDERSFSRTTADRSIVSTRLIRAPRFATSAGAVGDVARDVGDGPTQHVRRALFDRVTVSEEARHFCQRLHLCGQVVHCVATKLRATSSRRLSSVTRPV